MTDDGIDLRPGLRLLALTVAGALAVTGALLVGHRVNALLGPLLMVAALLMVVVLLLRARTLRRRAADRRERIRSLRETAASLQQVLQDLTALSETEHGERDEANRLAEQAARARHFPDEQDPPRPPISTLLEGARAHLDSCERAADGGHARLDDLRRLNDAWNRLDEVAARLGLPERGPSAQFDSALRTGSGFAGLADEAARQSSGHRVGGFVVGAVVAVFAAGLAFAVWLGVNIVALDGHDRTELYRSWWLLFAALTVAALVTVIALPRDRTIARPKVISQRQARVADPAAAGSGQQVVDDDGLIAPGPDTDRRDP